jgi:hypothetical protein
MQKLAYFYFALSSWLPLAPIVIVIVAVNVAGRMSKYKWLAHVATYAVLLFIYPIYIRIGGILDPTTIEYPGPGDGFGALLYLFFLVPSLLLYSACAWVSRRGKSQTVGSAL